ncbi:hypothetical protein [Comamonas sp. GB3 AK4-5]|uniref:hypothetical protein n=1 Tax=Comamonas sp. GB3 AK4-5 TaxID=3231487 RepID=UPI00351F14D2
MTRKTLIELASPTLYGPGSQGSQNMSIKLKATKSGGKLAFTARVTGLLSGGEESGTIGDYEISDDAGKIRTFRDADDVFTQMGALSMVADNVMVDMSNMSIVAPKPFTGDIIKKAHHTVASYEKRRAAVGERIQKLVTEAALMAADATVPQSRRDENTAQKVASQSLKAFLDAEIVRINAIIAG